MEGKKVQDIFTIKDVWTWFAKNNDFLNESNKHERKLKLMKLTFFSIEFYKAITGEVLVDETFEAWTEGPVSNKAYAQITQDDRSENIEKFKEYPEVEGVLRTINDIFGIYSAKALSQCTHLLDSWKNYYEEDENGKPKLHIQIPNEKLNEEFKELIKNLDYFYKFDCTKESACIVNDKTLVFDKKNENEFEFNYDKIVSDISENTSFENENLIFLSFDGGQIHYEL